MALIRGWKTGVNADHASTSRAFAQEADDFDDLAYVGKLLPRVLVELVDRIRVPQGEPHGVVARRVSTTRLWQVVILTPPQVARAITAHSSALKRASHQSQNISRGTTSPRRQSGQAAAVSRLRNATARNPRHEGAAEPWPALRAQGRARCVPLKDRSPTGGGRGFCSTTGRTGFFPIGWTERKLICLDRGIPKRGSGH